MEDGENSLGGKMLSYEDISLVIEALDFLKNKNLMTSSFVFTTMSSGINYENEEQVKAFDSLREEKIKEANEKDAITSRQVIKLQAEFMKIQEKLLDKKGSLTIDDFINP
jgi:hypothetical protein